MQVVLCNGCKTVVVLVVAVKCNSAEAASVKIQKRWRLRPAYVAFLLSPCGRALAVSETASGQSCSGVPDNSHVIHGRRCMTLYRRCTRVSATFRYDVLMLKCQHEGKVGLYDSKGISNSVCTRWHCLYLHNTSVLWEFSECLSPWLVYQVLVSFCHLLGLRRLFNILTVVSIMEQLLLKDVWLCVCIMYGR